MNEWRNERVIKNKIQTWRKALVYLEKSMKYYQRITKEEKMQGLQIWSKKEES